MPAYSEMSARLALVHSGAVRLTMTPEQARAARAAEAAAAWDREEANRLRHGCSPRTRPTTFCGDIVREGGDSERQLLREVGARARADSRLPTYQAAARARHGGPPNPRAVLRALDWELSRLRGGYHDVPCEVETIDGPDVAPEPGPLPGNSTATTAAELMATKTKGKPVSKPAPKGKTIAARTRSGGLVVLAETQHKAAPAPKGKPGTAPAPKGVAVPPELARGLVPGGASAEAVRLQLATAGFNPDHPTRDVVTLPPEVYDRATKAARAAAVKAKRAGKNPEAAARAAFREVTGHNPGEPAREAATVAAPAPAPAAPATVPVPATVAAPAPAEKHPAAPFVPGFGGFSF